jgi:hypothetical protein
MPTVAPVLPHEGSSCIEVEDVGLAVSAVLDDREVGMRRNEPAKGRYTRHAINLPEVGKGSDVHRAVSTQRKLMAAGAGTGGMAFPRPPACLWDELDGQ